MAALLLYAVLIVNGVLSLIHPWIGILLSYAVILLTPQNIWWWAFEGVQPLQWLVVPTMIGTAVAVLMGRVSLANLRTPLCSMMALLLASATVAYVVGPFVNVVNQFRFYDSAEMYEVVFKAYVVFFVATVLINSPKRLVWAFVPIVAAGLYLAYWANAQYVFSGRFGRIGGPVPLSGHSIYADENIFATVFVVCFPILLCIAAAVRSRLLKLLLLGAVPMLWHAVFLTASRGALVAIVVVLFAYVLMGRRFLWGAVVACLFAGALYWQGGDTLWLRSSTILEYADEESASGRLDAWVAATRMMIAHPFSGVGFASFGQAYPFFSETVPRIAHNTFFQIGAEWGVVAGFTYIGLMASAMLSLHRAAKRYRRTGTIEGRWWVCAYDGLFLALIGFFACSMFLSLEKFEVFHYLIALTNSALILGRVGAGQPLKEAKGALALGGHEVEAVGSRTPSRAL